MVASSDCIFAFFELSGISTSTGKFVRFELIEHIDIENGAVVSLKPFYHDAKYVADSLT